MPLWSQKVWKIQKYLNLIFQLNVLPSQVKETEIALLSKKCVVPENIHTHPRKVIGNSKGEGGFKSPIFKGKYGTKMEFPEGVGGSS